ncbi:transposase is3 : Mobile element protein OS=Cystobacter fuscus DSM 2262 GN=D187_008851 PE=4 SV=1 [Gemmata massiliana]|uniref:Transposase is3: Mobile element protein n=1 Tax=Gemmata massiliana TaxID=1210884 RepID=A0A6P2D3Z6_9BACT|nr:hypothetical protein [Gemmata massiliana]VTR95206.1 transposase is3 : Mobile element protein OS=Cystobacter fuscus DSM 2262 GN=D187_008851 PE=4 SV=1 [Gemmata massiliana]
MRHDSATKEWRQELVAANVLARDFNPEGPNESWCADTAYISTRESGPHLTAIEDLFSRMVVGYGRSRWRVGWSSVRP